MRLSHLFFTTLRDDPADAEMASHRLLVRAAAGIVMTQATRMPRASRCRLTADGRVGRPVPAGRPVERKVAVPAGRSLPLELRHFERECDRLVGGEQAAMLPGGLEGGFAEPVAEVLAQAFDLVADPA